MTHTIIHNKNIVLNERKIRNRYQLRAAKLELALLFILAFLANAVYFYFNHTVVIGGCQSSGCVQQVQAANIPLTKDLMILYSHHPAELRRIWTNESSRGTNDKEGTLQKYCEDRGESNEFGYGGMQMKWCYKDFQTAVDVVDKWLDTQTQEILCYYNLGIKTANCRY